MGGEVGQFVGGRDGVRERAIVADMMQPADPAAGCVFFSFFTRSGSLPHMDREPFEEAIVQFALSYPFARPTTSFIFHNGEVSPLPAGFKPPQGHRAVLAIGSNAAPEQLRRKYTKPVTIPVLAIETHGLDVVYTAHISRYGSVPATVVASPDTVTQMFATFLDADALRRMHETEGGYLLCRLRQTQFQRIVWKDDIPIPDQVYVYVCANGALVAPNSPVALSEIVATQRRFRSLTQPEIMRVMADVTGFAEESVEQFIIRNTRDSHRRLDIFSRIPTRKQLDDCFEVVSTMFPKDI